VTVVADPQAKALLTRVTKAYESVPAVRISFGPLPITLALNRGIVVAEQETSAGITYVSRSPSVTYVRQTGKSCWDRSQTLRLSGVGSKFPLSYARLADQPPHRVIGGFTLTVRSGTTLTVLNIRTPSYRITSMTVRAGTGKVVAPVVALGARPKIPVPSPVC
jgi:hypothetical protein